MPKIKGDIRIGQRAAEECWRLFSSSVAIGKALRMDRKTIFAWESGCCPSSVAIAKIHYLGGDVLYILTGRRSYVQSQNVRHEQGVYPEQPGSEESTWEGIPRKKGWKVMPKDYSLTPKGLAYIAMREAGIDVPIDGDELDTFWDKFISNLAQNGYLTSGESEVEA